MPKKTNEFQKLVKLIQINLAPQGAIVTESAIVGPTNREIDVLINTQVGMYQIKIAVEAKDEARPMSLDRLEQYVAKYRPDAQLGINKVVVVSRRGFTKSAKELGASLGFELLTLDEAKHKQDWADYAPPKAHDFSFSLPAHFHEINVFPENPSLNRRLVREGVLMCDECTKPHGLVIEHIIQQSNATLRDPEYQRKIKSELEARGGHVLATMNASYTKNWIQLDGERYDLQRLAWEIHLTGTTVPMNTKLYEQVDCSGNTKRFLVSRASALGKDIQIVVPNTNTPPPSITLDIQTSKNG